MDPETRGNALLAAELVKEGIAAAKAGQSAEARDVLIRAVALDERNVQAWLWLSGVVDSLEDREVCLENVLTLDPGHVAARQGLEFVRRQKPGDTPPGDTPPGGEPPSLAADAFDEPPAILVDDEPDLAAMAIAPMPETPAIRSAGLSSDAWEDEFLCPYCATITAPEDRTCPSCHQKLLIKTRRRQSMSGWLKFTVVLQAFSTVVALIAPLLLLAQAAEMVQVINPFTLLPSYLGVADPNAAAMAEAALIEVPRIILLSAFIPFLFSLLMLIGLLQRWKVMYYLMLIGAVLSLVSAIATVVLTNGAGLLGGIVAVVYGLFVIFIVFQMEDDFFMDERRIVMRIDPTAKNGMDFLNVGRQYMQQRMWALAVLHLRRAAGRMPEMIDTHLALAAALMNLKHYDEAGRALADARRVNPEHPDLQDLQKVWDQLTARA
jgi:tetratricopeptide (TPR) repeat protein